MFQISLKEMFRTPLKTVLFILLVMISSVLMSIGITIRSISQKNIAEFEKVFDTVGTVRQTADTIKTEALYNAQTKTYRYRRYAACDSIVSSDVLETVDADYIDPPEKRPYYAAYDPKVKVFDTDMDTFIRSNILIVEVSALESGYADHAIPVRIDRVIFGDSNYREQIYICDHHNDKAGLLQKGKKYVMALQIGGFAHDIDGEQIWDETGESQHFEYYVMDIVKSTQYTKKGDRISDRYGSGQKWDEVSDDFYRTDKGRRWESIGATMYMDAYTFPVIPTNATRLLMMFYHDQAFIKAGRDISETEYDEGKRVCLIREEFAKLNGLHVGDMLRLPLYYADYEESPGIRYPEKSGGSYQIKFIEGLLNAEGKPYEPFWDTEYKIVGLYETVGGGTAAALGRNAVIVPSKSILQTDENNIAAYGPMRFESTSFSIPNGSMEEYQAAFEKAGFKNLEIRLYDRGYSELKSGLDTVKSISTVLLCTGIAAALLVILFFSKMFIKNQSKRTAIERTLGLTRRQCAVSLLSGFMVIVLAASMIGCVGGTLCAENITEKTQEQEHFIYDMEYSVWTEEPQHSLKTDVSGEQAFFVMLITILFQLLISFAMGFVFIKKNMKKGPMELLRN